ncbi:Suf-domain-containing protein [Sistotremastrum suecicum HHB10207 ss-3]|uniref:mRNA 3'-end-processing protein RNA14 n=1 Tax=Sistotremastrum suecicum HHB10207 ss-3 TaxID=1314776 RepID=A0A166DN62_9AGAM|nr:Suf-domain-containing protein [Sistotremastrum suecicum HHB10207 ss-3]
MNNSASVELFKLYLHHIKFTRRCDVQTVHRAYEFALDCIGHDKDAGEVWLDYINFIDGPIPLRDWRKSGSRSITAKEAVVRINDMRRLYRRALQIPLVLLDTIWDAYCEFENTVSTQTADMMITSMQNEHEPSYTIARQQLRFLDVVGFLQQLSSVQPAALELPTRPRPSSSFQDENSDSLCHGWLCYLNWEEGNPLLFDLKTMEGEKEFVRRMKGVYKKAVLKLRFYEVIWCRWFVWYNELKGDKQSDKHNPLTILQTAIEANPTSLLLNFVLAEQYEIQQNHEEVHRVYTALIAVLQKELDGIERHLSQPSANKTEDASSTSFSHEDMSNQEGPSETLRGIFQKRIEELGSVWCEYMTFARRSRDQVASREIFAQARKSKHLDWRVFDYAAMTEYHLSKAANIATKIYDLGLKRYPTDAGFICQYLHFLVIINDESNARLLFEKVIANPTLTPEKARHIWDKWCSFECNFGDLAASQRMQKRMLEIYTAESPAEWLSMRHTHRIDAISAKDKGSFPTEPLSSRLPAAGPSHYSANPNPPHTPIAPIIPAPSPESRLASSFTRALRHVELDEDALASRDRHPSGDSLAPAKKCSHRTFKAGEQSFPRRKQIPRIPIE